MKKLMFFITVFTVLNILHATLLPQYPFGYETTEYYRFNITYGYVAYGVMTRDENDQPKLVIENRTAMKEILILRLREIEGQESVDMAYLDENDKVQWKKMEGKHSFIAYNDENGSMAGLFMFEHMFNRGEGIPPAKCTVTGNLKSFKWSIVHQKWIAGAGSGKITGYNDPQDFPAWNLAFPATNVTPERIFPVSGSCSVIIAGYWTEAQIRSILKGK